MTLFRTSIKYIDNSSKGIVYLIQKEKIQVCINHSGSKKHTKCVVKDQLKYLLKVAMK